MFSGIVKKVEPVVGVQSCGKELKIRVRRPLVKSFSKLNLGDSVAVDGICLTVEKLSSKIMQFHLGSETLKITGPGYWKKDQLVNLELPLTMDQPVGGHFVTGHIDGLAKVVKVSGLDKSNLSVVMELKISNQFKNFFWKKCFITLNGVSLTVNQVVKNTIFVCLIPETIKRTNLLKFTDKVPFKAGVKRNQKLLTFEVDFLSRAVLRK